MEHLIKNHKAIAPNGTLLIQAVIEHLFEKRCRFDEPEEIFPELVHSLDKDGFVLN
jgi:hypothetical protein